MGTTEVAAVDTTITMEVMEDLVATSTVDMEAMVVTEETGAIIR